MKKEYVTPEIKIEILNIDSCICADSSVQFKLSYEQVANVE